MNLRARIAVLAVAALALAALAVAYSLQRGQEENRDEGPGSDACPNSIPLRLIPSEGDVAIFEVEDVREPPRRVEELRYRFEAAGGGAGAAQDAPPPEGSLADAAAAQPNAIVRYIERAGGAGTVDAGDQIVLRAQGSFALTLLDAAGTRVGGTWGCV